MSSRKAKSRRGHKRILREELVHKTTVSGWIYSHLWLEHSVSEGSPCIVPSTIEEHRRRWLLEHTERRAAAGEGERERPKFVYKSSLISYPLRATTLSYSFDNIFRGKMHDFSITTRRRLNEFLTPLYTVCLFSAFMAYEKINPAHLCCWQKLAMCQLYCIFWLFYQIPDVIKVVCIFSISSLSAVDYYSSGLENCRSWNLTFFTDFSGKSVQSSSSFFVYQ